jgi:serine/threonine protein kinase/tetratricopeptide (TPR) repeat protein
MPVRGGGLVSNTYILHEPIGEGGAGLVYRATNRLTRDAVALKLLRTSRDGEADSGQGSSALERRVMLAREFQTLSSLHHPNVIRVYDYGFDETAGPYFTMELLSSPRDIVAAYGDRPAREKIPPLVDLLRALVYVHRRQVIHRDLKPSNVLVVDGRVRVVDFGIALARSAQGLAAGTIGYIAPEVLLGDAPSVASDLFAVGVIAYQLFAGRFPYDMSSASAFLHGLLQRTVSEPEAERTMIALAYMALGERHQDTKRDLDAPPSLLGLDDDLAAPLNRVVMRLLSPRPEMRYPSADAVIDDLGASLGLRLEVDTADTRESFLKAADFVGRDVELTQLLDALRAACDGRGSAWLVGGESGVGKSRLLDELRTRALVRNAQALRARATAEQGRAYQIWSSVLRALAVYVRVSDEEAGVLEDIVPGITALLDRPVSTPPSLPPALARERLYDTVARVLQRHGKPLVLLLEDLHWADADSLALLDFVSKKARELPLLIVANYRNDERPELPEALPELSTIALKRLSHAVVQSLVISMLGPAGGSPELTEFLERQTEGNAFFLVEVVRALAEETTRLADVAKLELPERIVTGGMDEVLRHRLARVPEDRLPLLRLAAIHGRQLDVRVLELAGAEKTSIDEWLMMCANAAVLEAQEGHWLFSHDKLRERVLAELSPEETRRLHHAIALAMEEVHGNSTERHPALARHYKGAGVHDKAADFYVKAADDSARLFAVLDARAYYAEALELFAVLPDTPELRRRRVDVALKQLTVSWYAVPSATTLALVRDAEELLGSLGASDWSAADRGRAASLCLYRGRAIYTSGGTAAALDSYRKGLDHVAKSGNLPLELLLKSSVGQSLMVVGHFREGLPYLQEALDVLARSGHSADSDRVAGFVGLNLAGLGRMTEGLAVMRAAMERTEALKYTTYIALQHIYPSVTYLFAEDWPQMLREGREVVRVALQAKDLGVACIGLALTEWSAVRLGDREGADDARRQFTELHARLGGSTLDSWHAVTEIDRVLAFGAPADALVVAERVVSRSKERGSAIGQILANRSWARALTLLGRYGEAEERLVESLRISDLAGDLLLSARTHVAWVDLCRARGDVAGAEAHAALAAQLVC